jgi:hypothetical protein
LFNDLALFPNDSNLKIHNLAFLMSKNLKNWQKGRFEIDEHLSPLSQLENPTGFHAINFGTKINLNFP